MIYSTIFFVIASVISKNNIFVFFYLGILGWLIKFMGNLGACKGQKTQNSTLPNQAIILILFYIDGRTVGSFGQKNHHRRQINSHRN